MRILIVNAHSFRNAGDAALIQVTVQQLRASLPGCSIVLSIDDTDQMPPMDVEVTSSLFTWVKKADEEGYSSWRVLHLLWLVPATLLPVITFRFWRKPVLALTPSKVQSMLRAYWEADAVVSKPGGFLYSSGLGLTLLVSVYIMALALLLDKPLYLLPQSIGPLTRRWECHLLKWILSKARLVMVRERISLAQLASCNLSDPGGLLVPDMAFAFQGQPREVAAKWMEENLGQDLGDGPILGMTVIDWGAQNPQFRNQEKYEAACSGAARFFLQTYGGRVILFSQVFGPYQSSDDRPPAQRVASYLRDLKAVSFISAPVPPDLLKALYGLTTLFIGSRTHSCIFALSQGVPTLAIGYQHKTRGIAQMAGIERWVIDIEDINEEKLVGRVAALWEEREAIRRDLCCRIKELAEQAQQAGAMVCRDLAKIRKSP